MYIERDLVNVHKRQSLGDFLDGLFGGDDDDETTTTTRPVRTSTEEEEETTTTTRRVRTTSTDTEESTTSSSTEQETSTSSSSSRELPTFTPPPRPTQLTTVTTTSASTSTSGTVDSVNGGSNNSDNGLSPLVIGIIVAASVIFGLIFIALIARKFFQTRRTRKRGTWGAGNIAPFSPPVEEEKAAFPPVSRGYGSTVSNTNADMGYNTAPAFGYGARGSLYEKPLPAPAPTYNNNPGYDAGYAQYNPNPAYNNTQGFSPAAASSAGYNAPYPFSNNAAYGAGANPAAMGMSVAGGAVAAGMGNFNRADLNGATPIDRVNSPPSTQISVVRRTFAPTLPDELSISMGESIRVIASFDDGWCKVQRMNSTETGMVPLECLEGYGQPQFSGLGVADDARSRRASSLYGAPQNMPRY